MLPAIFTAKQKALIGGSGAIRGGSAGMLATALIVYVGRNASPVAVGLLAAVFFLSMTVLAPLWGLLADLTGRRRELLIGLSLLATLGTLAFVLARSVWDVVGLRGLYAVFAVGIGPLMLSLVCALAGHDHRGQAAGFLGSSLAVGDMTGQVLVGVLIGLVAASELYLLIGAISLAGTAVLVGLDAESPSDRTRGVRESVRLIRAQHLPSRTAYAELHGTGLTWLYVGLSLRHIVVKGVASFAPVYLLLRLDVAEPVMGLLLATAAGGQLAFMPFAGRLADRTSRKRLVLGGTIMSGGFAFGLAATAVASRGPPQFLVAAGSFVLMAGGFAVLEIGTVSLLGDLVSDRHESTFLGFQSTAQGIGGIIGPILVGTMVVAVGYERAFAAVGLLAFVAAALIGVKLDEPVRTGASTPGVRAIETASGIPRPTDVSSVGSPDDR